MNRLWTVSSFACALAVSGAAFAQATVGQTAPAFAVQDTSGKRVSLDDFKGKYVVLEWVNPDCPFVQKHYNSGNMPATQKHALDKNVVWLSVNTTSGDGNSPQAKAELSAWAKSKGAMPHAILVDSDGKIGRAYGARTTPHMYLIAPDGKLVYTGAIDSKPSANPADIKTANNYVNQAIDEATAGKPVSRPTTTAYGCSEKYGLVSSISNIFGKG